MVASDQPLPLARPHTQSAPLAARAGASADGRTWTAAGTNGSAALQAAPFTDLDASPASEPEPVVQRALEDGPPRRSSIVIGGHRGGAATQSPPEPSHHVDPSKLTEEQLEQAYEFFEGRWRDRLWIERDLMGQRVDGI